MTQLKQQIADLLARQLGAIKSAKPDDLPQIAEYIAANLISPREDCLQRARELALEGDPSLVRDDMAKANRELAMIYALIAIAERMG